MKYIRCFLIALLIPFIVFAEECDDSKISIKSMTFASKTNYVEEVEEPIIQNNTIALNIKMHEVGDNIEYNLIIKNDSEEDYMINDSSFSTNSEYIKYELITDGNNVIKASDDKELKLKVIYDKEIDSNLFKSGKYVDTNALNLTINTNEKKKEIDIITTDNVDKLDTMKYVENPLTIVGNILLLIVLLLLTFVMIVVLRKKRMTKYLIVLISIMLVDIVYAICTYDIKVNSNIEIYKVIPNPCIFEGELVQGATYTNGQYIYKYMQEKEYNNWHNIEEDGWGVSVIDKNSTDEINTKLCTSINDKPIVSMSYMFYDSVTSSVDLSSFETSNIINMKGMFYSMYNITSLDVDYFDTSNVTDMSYMFYSNRNLENIDNLQNFDTKNVTNMDEMFAYNKKIKSFKITNWDFSNVESIHNMFRDMGYDSDSLDFEVSNLKSDKISALTYTFNNIGYNAKKLNVKVENIESLNDVNITQTFYNLGYKAENVNVFINNLNFKNSTNVVSIFSYMAYSATNVDLTISNINFESAINDSSRFNYIGGNAKGYLNVNLSNINMDSITRANNNFSDIGYQGEKVKINIDNLSLNSANGLDYIFDSSGENAKEFELNVTNLHARSAKTVYNSFRYVGQFTNKTIVKVKDWETPELTSALSMFDHLGQGVRDELELTIDNVDFSKITSAKYMFFSNAETGTNTATINIRNISTPNLTDVTDMFRYAGAYAKSFKINGLDNFDFSKVTNFYGMFSSSMESSNNITDLGTIDIYGDNISDIFSGSVGVKVTLNLHKKPTNYSYAFNGAATNNGASIIVNYSIEVDNIDDIIATKYSNSNVIKGHLID